MNRSGLSPRTLRLFAEAEQLAALVAELTSAEACLRRSADALWEEKTRIMALLADASRTASLAEAGETLRQAARRVPAQHS